jgi:phosphatidylserine decarboxylase
MKFAPEGWQLVSPLSALAVVVMIWGLFSRSHVPLWIGAGVLVLSFVVLLFFRDPERHSPSDPRAVVSPADGKVIITETLPDGRKHVAIFLSVFDVHVNRVPIGGEAERITVTPGAYFHAGSLRAGGENARVDVEARSAFGAVAWRQVSGSIARKISCRLKNGDTFQTGQRFGLIYFGSRMDVFLPASAAIATSKGKRVHAGESVIATF